MMRLIATVLAALLLAGCTTFALTGTREYRVRDDQGDLRIERITGLFAVPTPRGNTLILIPLHKSYLYPSGSPGAALPLTAQRWLSEQSSPSPPE
ncbi:hypothetical protein JXA47_06545 [Candidatus Sumerlaeota bacterium]|nr:hypothetical protein [Candidatus Sumerlaeota bacterium]